jgi:hypothetical protein
MKEYPLEAIGQFFEMPNKEAWINKIKPTLSFIGYNNPLSTYGTIFVFVVGLLIIVYLWRRPRD